MWQVVVSDTWPNNLSKSLERDAPTRTFVVIILDRSEDIRSALSFYNKRRSGDIVVTFRNPNPNYDYKASGRRWIEALEPSIWRSVMDSQLNHKTQFCVHLCSSDCCHNKSQRCFKSVAFGGSLDGCHSGHLLLIYRCIQLLALDSGASRLYIGLMPDSTVRTKSQGSVAYNYNTRRDIVLSCVTCFLRDLGFEHFSSYSDSGNNVSFHNGSGATVTVVICPLNSDGLGVADVLVDLECLVVSEETVKGGFFINERREAAGLAPLTVDVCPLVFVDDSAKLSSSQVRDMTGSKLKVAEHFQKKIVANLGEQEGFNFLRSIAASYVDAKSQIVGIEDETSKALIQQYIGTSL